MTLKRLVLCAALLLTSTIARADNLVTNGGFETGDFTGWTVTHAAVGSFLFVGDAPHSGDFSAHFDATVPGFYDTISQTLTTTVGGSYLLTFFLAEQDSINRLTADFQALWNGRVIYDSFGRSSENYSLKSFSLTGTGSDRLAFRGYNIPNRDLLDDVSVSTVATGVTPEPSSFVMLGTGLLGLAGAARRRLLA